MKVDLPSGAWASLRDPDEIPRKGAKGFRRALMEIARPFADTDTEGLDEKETAAVVGRALLASDDALDHLEDVTEALLLAVVDEWSYGPVTVETMDSMPDAVFAILDEKCQELGYFEKLQPDFGRSTDPDSPT